MEKVGLKIKAADGTGWREGVRAIAEGMRCIRPPSDTRKNRIETGYDDELTTKLGKIPITSIVLIFVCVHFCATSINNLLINRN